MQTGADAYPDLSGLSASRSKNYFTYDAAGNRLTWKRRCWHNDLHLRRRRPADAGGEHDLHLQRQRQPREQDAEWQHDELQLRL
jgi:hypothetical protein